VFSGRFRRFLEFFDPSLKYPFDPSHGPLKGRGGSNLRFCCQKYFKVFTTFFGFPPSLWNSWVAGAMRFYVETVQGRKCLQFRGQSTRRRAKRRAFAPKGAEKVDCKHKTDFLYSYR
jgi:hypothetical protein